MTSSLSLGDPSRIHLQWFAGEGNPGQGSQVAGQEGGSFLTGTESSAAAQGGQPEGESSTQHTESGQSEGGGQTPPSRQEGGAQRPAWKAQFPKDLQDDARFDRFPTIGDLGKAYVELEGKLGTAISIPGKDASAEDWNAYWGKLGRPAKPDEYKLEKLKDLPKGLEYGDDSGYRNKAHSLGLSKTQAEEMYRYLNEEALARYQTLVEGRKRSTADAEKALRKEWGNDFDRNKAFMGRAVRKFGDKETLALFESEKLDNHPLLIKLFARIGEAMGEGNFLDAEGSGPLGDQESFSYPGLDKEHKE